MPKSFYVFSADERFLHAAQWYHAIGSLPQQPSRHDHIIQHNADQILRMAILDNEFAKGVRVQIHRLLRDPLASQCIGSNAGQKKEKKSQGWKNEYRSR